MNRNSIRFAAILVAAVCFYASHSWAAAQEQSAAVSELRARVTAYERAWNTHDPSAVAAYFTTDADMLVGNLPSVDGRGAIQDWWTGYFANISGERNGSFAISSMRLITSDVALVNVDSRTGGKDADGAELPTRLARGTWVMVHRDGEWLIAALRALPAQGDVRLGPGVDRR